MIWLPIIGSRSNGYVLMPDGCTNRKRTNMNIIIVGFGGAVGAPAGI